MHLEKVDYLNHNSDERIRQNVHSVERFATMVLLNNPEESSCENGSKDQLYKLNTESRLTKVVKEPNIATAISGSSIFSIFHNFLFELFFKYL